MRRLGGQPLLPGAADRSRTTRTTARLPIRSASCSRTRTGRGTHANISGAGVTVNAPDKANAIKFLEYLTTDQAQIYFTQGNYEFPAVPGVPLEPALARLGDFKTDQINASKYGEHNAEAVKLMDRVGWN